MTAALEGSEWSVACPGRNLSLGKTRYSLYRMLGGPQGRSRRAENLVPTGIRSRTFQPVVNRYTDWATRYIPVAGILTMLWYHEKSCVNSTMGSIWPHCKRNQNINTVYYNVLFPQIIFHSTGLYSNIDKWARLCLRNFWIYRSRYTYCVFCILQTIICTTWKVQWGPFVPKRK